MKKLIGTLLITLFISLSMTNVVVADEYKAPSVPMYKKKFKAPKAAQEKWKNNNYKVDEDPESDRGVASGDEEADERWPDNDDPERGPSSKNKRKNQRKFSAEPWKYNQ